MCLGFGPPELANEHNPLALEQTHALPARVRGPHRAMGHRWGAVMFCKLRETRGPGSGATMLPGPIAAVLVQGLRGGDTATTVTDDIDAKITRAWQ